MIIHLIRHAHAGNRKQWEGADELRPLSPRGEAQARAIARSLADVGVDRLWSSRFTRCVQTLDPLARQRGLTIEAIDDLAEGGSGRGALDALVAAARDGHVVAASSHGDVIPEILDAARADGATLVGTDSPRKGARYELALVDGRVHRITHVDAPDTA